jgi:hypothetical protein
MKNEQTIREYFAGWENNDWPAVESRMADGFSFTSPNGDDHIDAAEYKDQCWPNAGSLKHFKFQKIVEDEATDEALSGTNAKRRTENDFRTRNISS